MVSGEWRGITNHPPLTTNHSPSAYGAFVVSPATFVVSVLIVVSVTVVVTVVVVLTAVVSAAGASSCFAPQAAKATTAATTRYFDIVTPSLFGNG